MVPVRVENSRVHAYGGQLFNEAVWRAETSQSDLLRELSESRIGEQRNVTEQFVHNVAVFSHCKYDIHGSTQKPKNW